MKIYFVAIFLFAGVLAERQKPTSPTRVEEKSDLPLPQEETTSQGSTTTLFSPSLSPTPPAETTIHFVSEEEHISSTTQPPQPTPDEEKEEEEEEETESRELGVLEQIVDSDISPQTVAKVLKNETLTGKMIDCVLRLDDDCPKIFEDIKRIAPQIFHNGGRCITCAPETNDKLRHLLSMLQRKQPYHYRRMIRGFQKLY